jgi:putative hydrolase of the HAD superfamily
MDQTSPANTRLIEAECWVFDLDNTLYPATSGVFTQIDRKMTLFISEFLDLDIEAANSTRKDFYRDYGTTLAGLMAIHGIEPEVFLDFVHDIDLSALTPDPELDQALARLPGRKIIFTNGPANRAEGVLERLSIGHHFEDIFDIIDAQYIPKPKPQPYDDLVRRHRLKPSLTVMVEDLTRNLKPAAALGMTTVWVRTESEIEPNQPAENIDHVVDDLARWLGALTAA